MALMVCGRSPSRSRLRRAQRARHLNCGSWPAFCSLPTTFLDFVVCMTQRIREIIIMMASFLALLGCDPSGRAYEDARLAQLKPGQSTEHEVRRLFGAPYAVRDDAGGKGLVYPLGPEGLHTLVIKIDANEKYQGRENLLTRENFQRIAPGQSESDVLRVLGPPGRTQKYALKQQTAWEWRFLDGNEPRLLVVMFNSGGNVVGSAVEEDPRRSGGG